MPKIVVIGAGPSGLAAVKSCKEENLDVVCFEKHASFGGVWRYDENPNIGSVSKTTISLFSKEMCAYSDFPPPEDYPNYFPHKTKLNYLKMYAEKFNILAHVKFNCEVLEVARAEDFESSGQWIVKWSDSKEQSLSEDTFDGVLVCIGRKNFPHVPHFPDQEIFRGKILHSKFLKRIQDFENQNVLVVGFGNAGVDAAVDISAGAKQVYLSTRNGRWVVPKVMKRGLPADAQFLKRSVRFLQNSCPQKVNSYLEKTMESRFSHNDYKIKPDHRIIGHTPIISDDLPDKILTARVIIKHEISRMTEDGVIFKDEDHETKVDTIILATGYETKFPFLEDRLWTTYKKNNNLFKYVFPLGLRHNTLAIIGHVQPLGPSIPIAEAQCRWAALVFKGKLKLPEQETMNQDVQTKITGLTKQFPKSPKQCPQVDYIDYMDEIAGQYDAKPNLLSLLAKDPALSWACYFGPCLPYQYRLQGPNACWNEARSAILNSDRRTIFPLNQKLTKPLQKNTEKPTAPLTT